MQPAVASNPGAILAADFTSAGVLENACCRLTLPLRVAPGISTGEWRRYSYLVRNGVPQGQPVRTDRIRCTHDGTAKAVRIPIVRDQDDVRSGSCEIRARMRRIRACRGDRPLTIHSGRPIEMITAERICVMKLNVRAAIGGALAAAVLSCAAQAAGPFDGTYSGPAVLVFGNNGSICKTFHTGTIYLTPYSDCVI